MSSLIKNKKRLFNFTAFITVISLILYFLAFSLPHELHCSKDSETSVLTSIFEKTHQNDVSNDTDTEEDNKNSHSSDNCPICNLSYFNSLSVCENFSNNVILQETNEKPVYQTSIGFSSFSYFKFFLRSPPGFIA